MLNRMMAKVLDILATPVSRGYWQILGYSIVCDESGWRMYKIEK